MRNPAPAQNARANTKAKESKRHNKLNSSARELIEAHKRASERHARAEAVLQEMPEAPWPFVTIPEIGPGQIYSLERLAEVTQQHIALRGLNGMDLIEFNQRVVRFRDLLKTQIDLEKEWSERSGKAAADDEEEEADKENRAAWEALLGRLKNSPRDHAQIAAYLAALEGEAASTWRLRQALKAIAGSGRRK
jgi:hypothetical protein